MYMTISSREYDILQYVADSNKPRFQRVVEHFEHDTKSIENSETGMLLRHLQSLRYIEIQDVNPFCEWPITLTSAGRSVLLAYNQYVRETKKQKRIGDVRYWITTGIAAAALVKAFLPEICAGLAYISTLSWP